MYPVKSSCANLHGCFLKWEYRKVPDGSRVPQQTDHSGGSGNFMVVHGHPEMMLQVQGTVESYQPNVKWLRSRSPLRPTILLTQQSQQAKNTKHKGNENTKKHIMSQRMCKPITGSMRKQKFRTSLIEEWSRGNIQITSNNNLSPSTGKCPPKWYSIILDWSAGMQHESDSSPPHAESI